MKKLSLSLMLDIEAGKKPSSAFCFVVGLNTVNPLMWLIPDFRSDVAACWDS